MRRIRAKHTAQSSTAVCSGGTIEEAATGEEKNEAIGEDHVWCCPEMKERESNVKGDEAIGGAVCFMVTASKIEAVESKMEIVDLTQATSTITTRERRKTLSSPLLLLYNYLSSL